MGDIAKTINSTESAMISSSFEHAMECLSWPPYSDNIESIYVIGGGEIYNLCINNYFDNIDAIYLTKVFLEKQTQCDRFFKIDTDCFQSVDISNKEICKTDSSISYKMVQLLPITENDKENNGNTANSANKKEEKQEIDDPNH